MNNSKIIIILMLFVTIGCTTGNVTVNNVISDSVEVIDIENELINTLYKEDLCENISIIKLETKPESVLYDIEKVVVSSSHIYIYDEGYNHGPAIFDINGQFIKRIENGVAPCEIGTTRNIFYDTNTSSLYVFDVANRKLVQYDKKGQFLGCHYFDYLLNDIAIYDNSIICAQASYQNPKEEFMIVKEDTLDNNISLWPMGKEIFELSKTYYFYYSDNGIGINVPYDNNIYSYKDNSVRKKYYINNKTSIQPSSFAKEWEMLDAIKEGEYIYAGENIESSNYQYLKYITKDTCYYATYVLRNKKTKKLTRIDDKGNSIFSLIKIHSVQYEREDVFVGVIKPNVIYAHPNPFYRWDGTNPNNLISPEDMQKLKNLKEDDNPVIVLFKLKSE